MAQVYTYLTLPLTKNTVIRQIEMPRGDNSRGLNILLTDEVFQSETEMSTNPLTATLWGRKPSGLEVSFDASQVIEYVGSNSYRIVFDGSDTFANLISELGIVQCTVTIADLTSTVCTFVFNIFVRENVALLSNAKSSTEYKNILDALVRIENKEVQLDELISQLTEQAKLTVGVRWGTEEPTVQQGDTPGMIYIKVQG